jgi:hypothetical protein
MKSLIQEFMKWCQGIKINIVIPLDSGGILLCVWLGWNLFDSVGVNYYSFGAMKDMILFLGVIMLILKNVDVKEKKP